MRGLLLTCCLLALTWGFSAFVYGRWQRVSGFATEADCQRIRTALANRFDDPTFRFLCCNPDEGSS